jgi:hypothetical protein
LNREDVDRAWRGQPYETSPRGGSAMKVTFSVIKADVGSIGGHTKPSDAMVAAVREKLAGAFTGSPGEGILLAVAERR